MLYRLAILVLFGVSLVCAKTYTFTVPDAAMVGSVQLKPGEYRLDIDGSTVLLLDKKGNKIDVKAKIESGDSKFSATSIGVTKDGDKTRLSSVKLRGTSDKVVFD